jgi:hypothetical protein
MKTKRLPDCRYTVAPEFTGNFRRPGEPCHVARFCGGWIGRADTRGEAVALARRERAAMLRSLRTL